MNVSDNGGGNSSDGHQTYTLLSLVSISTLTVVNLLGIIGDIMIIVILCKTKSFQTVSRIVLINTSVADILTAVITLLFVPTSILNFVTVPGDVKLGFTTTLLSLCSESSHSMTFNAIALYVAVCHSLKYQHVTIKKTVLLLVLTWMWNTGLSCLHFIQKGFYTAEKVTVSVTYDTTTWWFGCVLLLNAIVLPVTTSSFCYYRIRIYCTTLSQSMSTGSGFERSLRMMALARMNLACFVFFILSWIFIHLAQALKLPQGWTALATLTVYTYHALKIGLYLYLYAPFRNTARSLLRCRHSDHRVSDTFEMDTTERNTPGINTSNTR